MKKLIAVSSLLALVVAGSGLFAFDILNGEGEKTGLSVSIQAEYEFDIRTDESAGGEYKPDLAIKDSEADDNDKTWIEELDADKQGKLEIGLGYEYDNYAFGVAAGFRQTRATDDFEVYLNDAWGKYYLLDKQLSIRGGGLAGDWGGTIWDTFTGSWSDDNPGVQLAFASSALTGFSVGLSLPIPKAGTRLISKAEPAQNGYKDEDEDGAPDNKITIKESDLSKDLNGDGDQTDEFTFYEAATYAAAVAAKYGNWGPTYPIVNAVFGIRLNQTIPGLDFSTELKLNGNESNNESATEADEGEGNFKGFDVHPVFKYTFAPVTLQLSLPVTGIASSAKTEVDKETKEKKVLDPITKLAVRLTFDIPNAEGSALDLGDPWIQLKMLPNAFIRSADGGTLSPVRDKDGKLTKPGKEESFKDMEIAFEWEPNYSITDQFKAYLWLGAKYKVWANAEGDDLQKKYPVEVAVRPKLEFKFLPNATLAIQDKVYFARLAKEKAIRNELGFRFAFAF